MAPVVANKPAIYQKLSNLLDQESRLYVSYIKVIVEEQASVTKLSVERMNALSSHRELLLHDMHECQQQRQLLIIELGESPKARLSDVVARQFSKDSALNLQRKIDKLKQLVKKSQNLSTELNHVLAFSQRLANGCMAILTSATNNIFRSYSPFGKIREAYHPSHRGSGSRRI